MKKDNKNLLIFVVFLFVSFLSTETSAAPLITDYTAIHLKKCGLMSTGIRIHGNIKTFVDEINPDGIYFYRTKIDNAFSEIKN
jgi:hypothetical protein